ncbi:DMT family transporter [Paracoccus versutus]|uniref:DMT family transporter n=1 Tax=Paracoccus versutus TaxID=34007 RepID=UPI000DF7814E|nr:DMT family transporter [Paracoccus versutus]RDD70201.1 DMT family transporter [Paracoccus versutus]
MERVSAPPQETLAARRRHAANLAGALWMVAAMAGFTLEDAMIKGVSSTIPIAQILVTFGLGGALVFAGLARWAGESLFTPEVLSFPMRLRVVFEIAGRLFYVLALALIPLSAATVILQATPVVVVAAAALVFGERVGWRRWSAILLGMGGVLVIVRPGTDGFSILSLLAVAGMLGFAGRDLASRAAPASLGTNVLGFYGFLAVAVAGVMASFWSDAAFVLPERRAWLLLAGAVLCGVCAYACLMKAMRTGEVSAVTPFRYVRLIFGVALGVLLFGERLTGSMLIGSAMIVLSGLFIMWRSAKLPERG